MKLFQSAVFLLLCVFPCLVYAQDVSWIPYMMRDDLPSVVEYLPPPPEVGTTEFQCDQNKYAWGKEQRSTERGGLAVKDADYHLEYIAESFSEPFGYEISMEKCPAIYTLFARVIETSKQSVRAGKKFYGRKRPYVEFEESTPIPDHEEKNRKSGSFPSGHTAMGWGAALILTELNPDRANEILKRGYEYGESRIIVGYHYRSDVEAGRLAASAAFAAMHSDSVFQEQLKLAKKELKKMKKASVVSQPAERNKKKKQKRQEAIRALI